MSAEDSLKVDYLEYLGRLGAIPPDEKPGMATLLSSLQQLASQDAGRRGDASTANRFGQPADACTASPDSQSRPHVYLYLWVRDPHDLAANVLRPLWTDSPNRKVAALRSTPIYFGLITKTKAWFNAIAGWARLSGTTSVM